LTVTSTQDRHYVVVDDPLPAGCEAVNESFATESNELLRRAHRSADTDDSEGDSGDEEDYSWWWGGFCHFETYDDKVLAFADLLSNGTHTHTYLMKALCGGRFSMPQTKAEEMYSPEVFGWTASKTVEIK
ncbi:MAG TPA: hypothetical protein VMF29_04790, partial [Candidatus Edwardsbacteria bacterium]|nr:hypothetical protein [Candidatus Edwardsbacteria bacterium]